MSSQALGLIETIGLAAAVEAADTAIKSSNVRLIGYELTNGDGMVTVKFEGDVGAVKAAIHTAKISAEKVSGVFSTLIIPRPAKGVDSFVCSVNTVGIESTKEVGSAEGTEEPASSEITDIEKPATDEVTVSEESAVDETTVNEESVIYGMAVNEETATALETPKGEGSPAIDEHTVEVSPTLEEPVETTEAPKPRRSRKKLPSS